MIFSRRRLFRRSPLWFAVLIVLALAIPIVHGEPAAANRILILISLDAFRSDYLQKFNPPNLNRMAKEAAAHRLLAVTRMDRLEESVYWLLSAATIVYLLFGIISR